MLKRLLLLNPERDWASRRVSLRHNLRLVMVALLVASSITGWWYYCSIHSWPKWAVHVDKDGDKVMLTTAILVCTTILAVIAALMFNQTGDRVRELSKAVLLQDQQAFLILRDERISIRMHMVLGFFALSILVMLFVADYETAAIGAFIIFTVTLVIVLYFIAMLEMQDISTSAWFRDRTPPEWFTVKLDVHFQLEKVIQDCRAARNGGNLDATSSNGRSSPAGR